MRRFLGGQRPRDRAGAGAGDAGAVSGAGAAAGSPKRRDRHGRGLRGPLAPHDVPLSRTRSETFDELVLDAVEDVEDALREDPDLAARVTAVELGVEDVPPEDALAAAEGGRDLPLARGEADAGGRATRLVVYRRPVELRASDLDERARLVHDVVVDALADLLSVPVERLDPDLGD